MTTKPRGRRPVQEISDPQRRTLQKIRTFINQRGFPPTLIELGEMLGISSISVYDQVNQLVRKGYLRREPRKARGITIIRQPDVELTSMEPVMVVGQVSAGHLMFAEENIIDEVMIEQRIACSGRCFALEVKGDSMIDAGINDGDMVVVRQQPIAESGDIVVVLLGDEGTVKRLYIRENIIELRPENPNHKTIPIGPEDELRIIGKVVTVRRPISDS